MALLTVLFLGNYRLVLPIWLIASFWSELLTVGWRLILLFWTYCVIQMSWSFSDDFVILGWTHSEMSLSFWDEFVILGWISLNLSFWNEFIILSWLCRKDGSSYYFVFMIMLDLVEHTVPVGGAQEVWCVPKVLSMDLHSQMSYEAGVKILKMNSWEKFEKTWF